MLKENLSASQNVDMGMGEVLESPHTLENGGDRLGHVV